MRAISEELEVPKNVGVPASQEIEQARFVIIQNDNVLTSLLGRFLAVMISVTATLQYGGIKLIPIALVIALFWSIKVFMNRNEALEIRSLFKQLDDVSLSGKALSWTNMLAEQRLSRKYELSDRLNKMTLFEPVVWFVLIVILALV